MGYLAFVQTVKSSANQNLTTLGGLDWRHWSGFSQNSSTRKTSGAGISDLSAIGSITADQNAASGRTLSASDPTLSSDDAGVFYGANGTTGWGERFTLDIGTTRKKCWILFGQFSGAVKVDISLSDSSASAISYTYSASSIYSLEGLLVEFDLEANSASQTATVDITCSTNIDSMRIGIQAVALANASADTNITCAIGSATASGLSATVDQQKNITGTIGTATASGLSAAVDQQQNITGTIGTATASGLAATIDLQQNITCAIGTAVASGLTATLGGDTTISCSIGAATASGLAASVDQQQNLTCAIGTAVASGLSATLDNNTDISCTIGTATASGLSASIDNNTDITCGIGTATASGLSASIESNTEINCAIGTAVASGLSISLGGDTSITCSIGTANASGLTLTIDQQQNITCSIGVAVASGLEVSFNAEGRIKQAIKEAYASAPSGTIIIHTLEFRHPNFVDELGQPTAIRVVLGHQNLEARLELDAPQNGGEYVTFIPMAFDLELPNIEHIAVPEITIAIDNVSREIEDNLMRAAASPYKIEVTYRPYLNTDLTEPQMNPPTTMTLISAEADDFRVTARATYGNAANVLTPREVYTSDRFPGLQR